MVYDKNEPVYCYDEDGIKRVMSKEEFEKYVMDKGGYSSMEEYYEAVELYKKIHGG